MLNRTKKGFSLVEVMILMTLLAVFMAAAVPILSRKTHSIPRKYPHGVYRCIGTEDGFIEEYYSKFRLISRRENVGQCRFQVPQNVANFKVDLYGAGAGGTQYADYTATGGYERNLTFSLDSVRSHANGRTMRDLLRTADGLDFPFIPTNEDFIRMWNGLSLARSNPMPKAGDGGKASLKYADASNALCMGLPMVHDLLYHRTQSQVIMPVYQGKTGRTFGFMVGEIFTMPVREQYESFCQYMYEEAYNDPGIRDSIIEAYGRDANLALQYHDPLPSVGVSIQEGERGGNGNFLLLRYNLNYLNPNLNQPAPENDYPFLRYVNRITLPSGSGYSPMKCQPVMDDNNNPTDVMDADHCDWGVVPASPKARDMSGDVSASYNMFPLADPLGGIFNYAGKVSGKQYYAMYGGDGFNVEQFTAFHIPDNNNANSPGTNVTSQIKRATGGSGGVILVQKNNKEFTPPSPILYQGLSKEQRQDAVLNAISFKSNDLSWKVIATKKSKKDINCNSQNRVISDVLSCTNNGEGEGVPGDDAEAIFQRGNNYTLENSDIGVYRDPYIDMKSTLWRKTYNVGQAGSPGSARHVETSALGATCTIRVSRGGEILNLAQIYNEGKLQNLDSEISSMEQNLATEITCQDENGRNVFRANVDGGRYNPTPIPDAGAGFTWSRNVESYRTTPAPQPEQPAAGARIGRTSPFSKIMGLMPNLQQFRISQGGNAPVLEDRCVMPKGEYTLTPQIGTFIIPRDILNNENPNIASLIHPENMNFYGFEAQNNRILSDENDGIDEAGLDCYQNDNGKAVHNTIRHIGRNTGGIDTATEAQLYQFTGEDTRGGGGAVMITW